MSTAPEYSIIVETFTTEEGGNLRRLKSALHAATSIVAADAAEVLVADASGAPTVEEIVRQFPQVKHVKAGGLGYDDAKSQAICQAAGRYILFLDGDCIPQDNWHSALLAVLRDGRAVACGGYTRYEGGFLAAVMSIMDFGFLYPVRPRSLQCYASNNCGFTKEALQRVPYPDGDLRCRCFYHAQLFWRRGTPMQMVPGARVLHEMQPIIRERSRQGYDAIAACWLDPQLVEARWLRFGVLSLPLFYLMDVGLDCRRLLTGWRPLGLSLGQAAAAVLLFPWLRLIDAAGMLRALLGGPVRRGWGGWLERRRSQGGP